MRFSRPVEGRRGIEEPEPFEAGCHERLNEKLKKLKRGDRCRRPLQRAVEERMCLHIEVSLGCYGSVGHVAH